MWIRHLYMFLSSVGGVAFTSMMYMYMLGDYHVHCFVRVVLLLQTIQSLVDAHITNTIFLCDTFVKAFDSLIFLSNVIFMGKRLLSCKHLINCVSQILTWTIWPLGVSDQYKVCHEYNTKHFYSCVVCYNVADNNINFFHYIVNHRFFND